MEGFVEAVEAFQIRGWAFEPADASQEVAIRICIGREELGRVKANLFRADLKENEVGNGYHAFIFNCDRRLTPEELSAVSVGAEVGADEWLTLERLPESPPVVMNPRPPIVFGGRSSDETQSPIFVLGAARSGTSAVAQALLKSGYEGSQEGHFIDLLAYWEVSLARFLDLNRDEYENGRDTMISRFSPDYLNSALDALFLDAARAVYSTGKWIDKTPNSDMVNLAPRLKRIWPRARFIFMRRRFFENALSRTRKFPQYNFRRNCEEWSSCMSAWLRVRSELAGCAIEVDQRYMMSHPGSVASAIGTLMGWLDEEVLQYQQALTHDWPERTVAFEQRGLTIDEMSWTEDKIALYKSMCSEVMNEFNYSEDSSYFLGPNDTCGLVVL